MKLDPDSTQIPEKTVRSGSDPAKLAPEVDSSRTHFEILGLGLKASSPRKFPSPWLKDSTIFWIAEILSENARNLAENLRRPFSPEKIFEELFSFGEHLLLCRLTVRPGLAGTVPILRPCFRVQAGWWKCPGFLFVCDDYKKIGKNLWLAGVKIFFWDHLKTHAKLRLSQFSVWKIYCPTPVSLVLGLEHFCPWPRKVPSSEGRSLAFNFFVS